MSINGPLSSGVLPVAMAAITRALLGFHSELHHLLPDGAWVSAGCRERTRGIRVPARNPFRRELAGSGPLGGPSL
jgi:hypothetical protein